MKKKKITKGPAKKAVGEKFQIEIHNKKGGKKLAAFEVGFKDLLIGENKMSVSFPPKGKLEYILQPVNFGNLPPKEEIEKKLQEVFISLGMNDQQKKQFSSMTDKAKWYRINLQSFFSILQFLNFSKTQKGIDFVQSKDRRTIQKQTFQHTRTMGSQVEDRSQFENDERAQNRACRYAPNVTLSPSKQKPNKSKTQGVPVSWIERFQELDGIALILKVIEIAEKKKV